MEILRQIKRVLGTAALCAVYSGAAAAGEVSVFAAASLKESLDIVARAFTAKSGKEVTLSYAGSSVLARQIELGAPADVFISASRDWMDRLEARNAVRRETRVDLLGNRLVLIGPATDTSTIDITPDLDLTGLLQGGRLAMALTDAVPAGIYGKAALESLGLWAEVAPLVAETDNVRAALALVAIGAAPLGIVYATDAKAEPRVAIVGLFPPASHPEIVYPAAMTTRAREEDAAAFLDYLSSDAAHDVFRSHGFVVVAE